MVVPTRHGNSRQLAGRADAPRELFSSRRSFCAICCQYGWAPWAWFQLHLRDEYARASIYAWRPLLSMRIRSSSSPQLVLRPAAMPNPRRSRAQKTGAPTSEKGVRCAPPTAGDSSSAPSEPSEQSSGRQMPPRGFLVTPNNFPGSSRHCASCLPTVKYKRRRGGPSLGGG